MTVQNMSPQKRDEEIAALSARISALEVKHPPKPSRGPTAATDAFACKMLVSALATGFKNTLFTRCEPDYYERPLEHRRAFLKAPSMHHLTKSIVLHNTRFVGDGKPASHPLRGRFVCCIVPYTTKIDSDALREAVRKELAVVEGKRPSAKEFNFRLAEDCLGTTGYEPNGVTPLGIRTEMPVVLAKQIMALEPGIFWLGGGEVSLKWRVDRKEFVKVFQPFVLEFASAEEE